MAKMYGSGEDGSNPFYPNETTFEGPSKAICSPYGSIFEHQTAKMNAFEDRLSPSGAVMGKNTNSENAINTIGRKGRK